MVLRFVYKNEKIERIEKRKEKKVNERLLITCGDGLAKRLSSNYGGKKLITYKTD
jgi:hypothetical protein